MIYTVCVEPNDVRGYTFWNVSIWRGQPQHGGERIRFETFEGETGAKQAAVRYLAQAQGLEVHGGVY